MREVISGMLLLALGITIVAITLTHTESDFVQNPIGEIKLSTELPEAPAKMPLYRVVGDESEVRNSSHSENQEKTYHLKRKLLK